METNTFQINKNLVISTLAFIAGALLAYGVFSLIAGSSRTEIQSQSTNQQTGVAPVETDPTIEPSTTNPDENIFVSKALKVSFNYLKYGYSFDESHPGVDRSFVVSAPRITDNTISFGTSGTMTMYQKQPGQSLETAITSQFLAGIPTTKCLPVRIVAGGDNAFYTPGNGISYVILHSVTPGGCGTQFNFENPSAAFISFSGQTDKFFYVIGENDGTLSLLTAQGEPFWVTMKFSN